MSEYQERVFTLDELRRRYHVTDDQGNESAVSGMPAFDAWYYWMSGIDVQANHIACFHPQFH